MNVRKLVLFSTLLLSLAPISSQAQDQMGTATVLQAELADAGFVVMTNVPDTNGNYTIDYVTAARDVLTSLAYLRQSPTARTLLQRLHASDRKHVIIVADRIDLYIPRYDAVLWNPFLELRTTDGAYQSASISLLHELGHAENQLEDALATFERSTMRSKEFDDMEERLTVERWETPVARELGEGVRHDHGGTQLAVSSPTLHGPDIPITNGWDDILASRFAKP